MGSDESHFNVSLIVRDKVTRQCPQTTILEVKGAPKQIRTEVPLLTSLPPYLRRHLCFLFVCFFALLPKQQCCQIHQCGPFIQKHPSIITTYFSRLTHSRVAVRLIFSACSSCPFVGQTLVVLFVCLFACFVAKTTILPSTSVWAAYSETSIHRYNMPPAQSFTRRWMANLFRMFILPHGRSDTGVSTWYIIITVNVWLVLNWPNVWLVLNWPCALDRT